MENMLSRRRALLSSCPWSQLSRVFKRDSDPSTYRCYRLLGGFRRSCPFPKLSFDLATTTLDPSSIQLPCILHWNFLAGPDRLCARTQNEHIKYHLAHHSYRSPRTRFPMNKIDSISSDKMSMLNNRYETVSYSHRQRKQP